MAYRGPCTYTQMIHYGMASSVKVPVILVPSVQLPALTTHATEVGICCNLGTSDEDVPAEFNEIYVQ